MEDIFSAERRCYGKEVDRLPDCGILIITNFKDIQTLQFAFQGSPEYQFDSNREVNGLARVRWG
jgi:hypothetical protein